MSRWMCDRIAQREGGSTEPPWQRGGHTVTRTRAWRCDVRHRIQAVLSRILLHDGNTRGQTCRQPVREPEEHRHEADPAAPSVPCFVCTCIRPGRDCEPG